MFWLINVTLSNTVTKNGHTLVLRKQLPPFCVPDNVKGMEFSQPEDAANVIRSVINPTNDPKLLTYDLAYTARPLN